MVTTLPCLRRSRLVALVGNRSGLVLVARLVVMAQRGGDRRNSDFAVAFIEVGVLALGLLFSAPLSWSLPLFFLSFLGLSSSAYLVEEDSQQK